MNPRIPHLKGTARPNYINYRVKSDVSITLRCQLCSTRYTAFRIKNCSKSTSTIHAYQKINRAARPNHINYRLKSEVSITLCCRLCSTHYTAVRINNNVEHISDQENNPKPLSFDYENHCTPSGDPPCLTSLKVISLNCCSLRSLGKRAVLKAMVDEYKPDIIIGCETHLDET